MAFNAFLRIPDIEGESTVIGHEDEIEIHGVHWQVKQNVASTGGAGAVRGRAEIGAFSVWKNYDAASPYLVLATAQNRAFAEAILSFRKSKGEASRDDYLKITLHDCRIASYEMVNGDLPGGVGFNETATEPLGWIREKLELTFGRIVIRYTEQRKDGSTGETHEIDYDVMQAR
jgi:type VI secretion system Hcp family effector